MGDDDLARPVTGHWCIQLWHWQSGLRDAEADAEADLSASNISPTLPESSLDSTSVRPGNILLKLCWHALQNCRSRREYYCALLLVHTLCCAFVQKRYAS